MVYTTRRKTKIFQVAYKSFYHEFSDWDSEYINAISKQDALRIFAHRHKIVVSANKPSKHWTWWNGDWYMSFRFIREVDHKPNPCPHCHGTGILTDEKV